MKFIMGVRNTLGGIFSTAATGVGLYAGATALHNMLNYMNSQNDVSTLKGITMAVATTAAVMVPPTLGMIGAAYYTDKIMRSSASENMRAAVIISGITLGAVAGIGIGVTAPIDLVPSPTNVSCQIVGSTGRVPIMNCYKFDEPAYNPPTLQQRSQSGLVPR